MAGDGELAGAGESVGAGESAVAGERGEANEGAEANERRGAGLAHTVSLPMSAIVDGDGMRAAVFVVEDGAARRVDVQVAAIEGDRIQVRAPDIVGRPVVVTGAPYLRDGDAVTVAESDSNTQEPVR